MARKPPLKIAVITGTRAEYGLLRPVIRAIQSSSLLTLELIVTGTHLAPEYGQTESEIEKDGFAITRRVPMVLGKDGPVAVVKAMAEATAGFADAFEALAPDIIMVLGDRFEILAAAQAALVMNIPVAHISGGDVTEGAMDDAIRHSITKMSHLHFVAHEEARQRVRQLGESPDHIFLVGNPGLDELKTLPLLSKAELESELGFKFQKQNFLITYHPETIQGQETGERFKALLAALERFPETGFIFTLPNADPHNHSIIKLIEGFVKTHPTARAFASLGKQKYWSVMKICDVVIGNSSSGLLEAPSFHTPCVNVGDRQKGRLQPASVVNCGYRKEDIYQAILKALQLPCKNIKNPYDQGGAAQAIVKVLESLHNPQALLKKHFYDGETKTQCK